MFNFAWHWTLFNLIWTGSSMISLMFDQKDHSSRTDGQSVFAALYIIIITVIFTSSVLSWFGIA